MKQYFLLGCVSCWQIFLLAQGSKLPQRNHSLPLTFAASKSSSRLVTVCDPAGCEEKDKDEAPVLPQAYSYDLVSMPAFLRRADLADSDEAPCTGNVVGARKVAQQLLEAWTPKVVALQRPCSNHGHDISEFFEELEKSNKTPPAFVLLLVDGDPTLNASVQARLRKLRGLKKVFATNLAAGSDQSLFEPQPQGMCYHCVIGNYEQELMHARRVPISGASSGDSLDFNGMQAATWLTNAIKGVNSQAHVFSMRDTKIFVGPMNLSYQPLRSGYYHLLKRPEYSHLVKFYDGPRLSIGDFLVEIAKHKAALSPPGWGYDCYRHWETLAVGTVPLVVKSTNMDMRLFENTGARFIPEPSQLTPKILEDLLHSIEDPSPHYDAVTTKYWEAKWRAALQDSGEAGWDIASLAGADNQE